jgi:hypothetical protein
MNITIEHPVVFVVEGKDEERFFGAMLRHMGISNVQVLGIGGKANLTPRLKALVHGPFFNRVIRLGVVRDADDDPEAAFQSVSHSLGAAGLAAPTAPSRLFGDSPAVAVLIVPPEGTGALEDICLSSVANDPAIPCITAFFDCVEPLLGTPRHIGKAKVQAFLSCRPEEGKRLGEAAEAGYWPWEAPCFGVVKEFIRLVTAP